MRVIATITDPQVARRILECLDLPPRAPPLAAPNEVDEAVATTDPGFEFDPSVDTSDGWDPISD